LEVQPLEGLLPDFPSLPDPSNYQTPSPTPALSPSPTDPLNFSLPPQPKTPSNLVQIKTCNGRASRANFRELPTLDSSAILGEIRWGDWVRLKGRVIQADGVIWHEAVAPALILSRRSAAQNQLESGQTGWIADCFVT
jgi:hypothetical protein